MKSRLLLTGLTAAVLSACGGGDGAPSATPTVTTTSISGTAAVGAALENATVQAKCASGSGSATTAADGTFTINIANAVRPCVLSVTTPDNTVLHSVVEAGSGTTAVANISPFTELITAALAQGSTTAFFNQFDAAAQGRLTSANLSTSSETVRLALTGVVDLNGFDPLKGALVAANNGKPGNALDQLLDTLGTRLKSSKATVDDLATAIVSNAGSAALGTLLQKASATCAGLRTGEYFLAGPGTATATSVTIDADALTLTQKFAANTVSATAVASTVLLTPTDENCRFALKDVPISVLVSKLGVSVLMQTPNDVPTGFPMFMVPVQQLPLSDLAGDWNAVAVALGSGSAPTSRSTFTLDANGKMTAAASCNDDNVCTPWDAASLPSFVKQADGSFLASGANGSTVAIAFKSTDGVVSAVVSDQGSLMVASKQVVRTLPAVGSKNAYWDYVAFSDGSVNFSRASTEILSTDPVNNIYTRKRIEDGRVDAWKLNVPATGLRYRAKSSNADEAVQLALGNTGVGVNLGLHVSKPYFDVSVNRP